MKWIVGVDLREGCEGAFAFADWISGYGAEAVAVHVTDRAATPGSPYLATVRDRVERFVSERRPHMEARILATPPAEQALARAVSIHHADALTIGRRAPRKGDELLRLGRVARRLLRRLPCPVAVCPADLLRADLGNGPVMAAVIPDGQCEPAVRFARELAKRTKREVVPVSVLPEAFPAGVTYAPAPGYRGESQAAYRDRLRSWLDAQGLHRALPTTGEGPTVRVLLDAARELGACSIVCGSRLLSAADRITNSSVGAALAASSPMPVIVVPPGA